MKDNFVIIAGGSSGLGFDLAKSLVLADENVILIGKDETKLQRACRELSKICETKITIKPMALDLSETNSIENLKKEITNYSINKAVACVGNGSPIEDLPLKEKLLLSMSRNLFPSINFFESVIDKLIDNDNSAFVFVSSICGVEYMECPLEYSIAKSAFGPLTKHLSQEFKDVRINSISPGNFLSENGVWSKRFHEDRKFWEDYVQNKVALGRIAEVSEITEVIIFLMSEKASFITGSNFVVDGGQVTSW